MGELIFDFNQEGDMHYNSDGGCQISVSTMDATQFPSYMMILHTVTGSKCITDRLFKIKLKKNKDKAVSGSEDTIAVDSSSVIKNNEKLKRLELYYNKSNKNIGPIVVVLTTEPKSTGFGIGTLRKIYYLYRQLTNSGNDGKVNLVDLEPISEGTIEQTELDNEYEALHTTLTLNIKNGTCIFESSLDNTSTNSGISSIKLNGPTNVEHSYSFIFYDCEFSSKGFNQIRIENTDDDPYYFDNFKGSDYNDVNLDKMRVYCSSDDLGRNLPLLIQFCSKSHYKFPDSRQTNTSNYYELYKAEEIKVETSKVEDGSTLSTETFYTFRKSYKKIESLMQTQLLEKLQFIYDSNNVREKLYKMMPDSQKQISGSATAGIVLGVLGLFCIPAGVLGYIHHNRARSI
ncbi:hypothetical protein TOT_030000746 [Theileria orientalis strain Shintoku]|uniref:Uncharacterized protein n=1 Tax=Theileria orientalis strain Shintoku TaxID=869250 RepID=J4DPX9_THEOR|nr:hypothetical protein TOT_030000746 [Theileria orientalis strain Shintoku]BAM41484.1 hypothetical protein TOT_030000746 [Theileria orientalis strain Shintoku]|eukprot:XP_009691785.1 hypothetical protein TOT_030000746 [Theileria orientalis strain Shintoku]